MQKILYILLLVLCVQHFAECRRGSGGSGGVRGGSGGNARRPNFATSRPNTHNRPSQPVATSRPISNVQSQPQPSAPIGPPPPYSPQTFNQPGHIPPGGNMYHGPPGAMPPAQPTYFAPGQLPPGAVVYPAPPAAQSSSGPGFATGLIGGAIGGAILGHVLTPNGPTHVVSSPGNSPSSNDNTIIIINPGEPGSVTVSNATGVTVIDTNASGTNTSSGAAPGVPPGVSETPTPLAPFQPGTTQEQNSTAMNTDVNSTQPQSPPPGSIACYKVLMNETDPNDSTKMVEVEKIACYEVPPNNTTQSEQQTNQLVSSSVQTPLENASQHSSSATIAESTNIEKSGSSNFSPVSFWSTLTFTVFVIYSEILVS